MKYTVKQKALSVVALLFFASCASSIAAQTLTIKNTFGADEESLGDYNLYSYSKETDINGDTVTNSGFALGNSTQADWVSEHLDARIKLEFLYQNIDSDEITFGILPTGYVYYEPIKQFGIILGNNFYKKFAIPSAYLAASDDTTKYGRLLTGKAGSDYYVGSTNFAAELNEFSGGITSSWGFGDYDNIYLNLAAGGTFYTDYADDSGFNLDFGLNAGMDDVFDMGFTAHNVTSDYRKFGAFAGLETVPNLILNGQFYYNFTDSDYLPEACVTRKDDDGNSVYKYKKQSTKYALGLTGGYEFEDLGLGLYADFISGLTNEYIGEVKYYDSDGNLVETKVTTIIRDSTIVKYKNNKAKRTDEYPHEAIPFYAQVRLTKDFNKSLKGYVNVKVRATLYDSNQTWYTFYPHFTCKLPNKLGTVGAGLKIEANLTRYAGVSGLSIPLTYTYKFKQSF